MQSQCNFEQTIFGRQHNCQFNVSANDLIDLGGKKWCRFHLPPELNGEKSEKFLHDKQGKSDKVWRQYLEEWENYVKTFNSQVFEYIILRFKEIRELLDSDSADGDYEVDLSGVYFPDYIDFRQLPESEMGFTNLNLNGASFGYDVEFSGLKFHGITSFINAKFNRQAIFDEATFERVSFRHAFFHGAALFEKATINAIGDFRDTIFNGEAVFNDMKCNNGSEISFENAEFRYGGIFREARFSGRTSFRNALFSAAYFSNAVFTDDVTFEITEEKKKSQPGKSIPREGFGGTWFALLPEESHGVWMMDGTNFHARAIFRGREFRVPADFSSAEFHIVPEFHDCIFNIDTKFTGSVFHDYIGHAHADAVGAYRTLQQAVKQAVSKEEEINLAALRQNALIKSPNTPLFHKAVLSGFRLVSDFGRNISKTAILIVLVNLLFFLAYEWISWSDWESAGKCISFAMNQIISPYEIWADSYMEKAPNYVVTNMTAMRLITTIHTTLHALLTLALAWSIQIRFKIF